MIRGSLLVLLLVIAWITCVTGDMLQYNPSAKQLTIRCPAQPVSTGDIFYIVIQRQHDDLPIANWTNKDKGQTMYERLSLQTAQDPYLLEVVLEGVTCFDVTTYTCKLRINPPVGPTTISTQSQPFTMEGDVTEPVLRVQPLQARYNVGDSIKLTCSARIGSSSNGLVWETRLPGADQYISANGECHQRTDALKSVHPGSGSCGVTSESSMTHIVTSADDSREWRCRLNATNQQTALLLAVQCPDGTGCSKPCSSQEQSTEVVRVTDRPTTHHDPITVVRASAVIGETQRKEALTMPFHTLIILISVICVLFIVTLVSVVVMTTRLRGWKKKQAKSWRMSPFFSSNQSDETTYTSMPMSTDQSRSLPEPPSVNPYYSHHEDDLQLGLGLTTNDGHETSTKIFSPASSSIYIAMSAITALDEEGGGVSREGQGQRGTYTRSESIYSNGEAVGREANKVSNGNAGSHGSDVTIMGNLKI